MTTKKQTPLPAQPQGDEAALLLQKAADLSKHAASLLQKALTYTQQANALLGKRIGSATPPKQEQQKQAQKKQKQKTPITKEAAARVQSAADRRQVSQPQSIPMRPVTRWEDNNYWDDDDDDDD